MKLPRTARKHRPAAAPPDPLTVRETAWGYVIRSERPGGGLDRAVERVGAAAGWVAAVGVWLVPVGWLPGPALAVRVFGSATLLAVFYLWFVLTKKRRGYEIQVDTARRELRVGEMTACGDARLRSRARFDEIGDGVWRKAGGAGATRDLCLRLKGSGEVLPVYNWKMVQREVQEVLNTSLELARLDEQVELPKAA